MFEITCSSNIMGISISSSSPLKTQMPQGEDLVIVKLGGSVITHKSSTPPKMNRANLERIADELKGYAGKLILVLGGGAYGHQAAHAYGYASHSTSRTRLIEGIPHIRHNMSLLSLEVESLLRTKNLPSVVLSPFSIVCLENGEITHFSTRVIRESIASGFIVIVHGDVCFDTTLGASILSGDTIAAFLAKELKANALYLGTNVDGIFECDPNLDSSVKLITLINGSNKEEVLKMTGPSSVTDVTGGMEKKLRELFVLSSSGIEVAIFNLEKDGFLTKLLQGQKVSCTRIAI